VVLEPRIRGSMRRQGLSGVLLGWLYRFVDHMAVPGKMLTTSMRGVRLDISDIAFGTPIPFDLSATLLTDGNHNIRLRGQVGPLPAPLAATNVPVDIHLQATDVLLAQLIPYVGTTFPLTQGRVGTDVNNGGVWEEIFVSAALYS
jgi:Domain of Unknown Function (DUF748)